MRLSKAFLPTLKEVPSEADSKSHQLMLRAGMIRLHTAGVYSYLPLGWRVIKKVAGIIREEMDHIGGQEFLLPSLSRRDIWEKTGREEEYGDGMFRLKDRKGAALCLAPTHEEAFTEIASREIRSYRDLPQMWYQIQTKFRDEARPRSGVLRGRQFLMKDAYSFDVDETGLDRSYQLQREAYCRIFRRCGLETLIVGASSGIMGGSESEEFMVLSPTGEDEVAICKNCGYASNLEVATSVVRSSGRSSRVWERIHTPGMRTIRQVSEFLQVSPSQLMKSLLFVSEENRPIMVLIRGDHEVNEDKLEKALGGSLRQATGDEILKVTGAEAGFIGPVGLDSIEIVADKALEDEVDIITGANEDDYHLRGLEPDRDFAVDRYFDLRYVKSGEGCPLCGSPIDLVGAIEVGHIFKLGKKYSKALGATFLDPKGRERPIVMGSYGIGLERIVASVIEQSSDENGIVWPMPIAPYQIHILPINPSHGESQELSERLYRDLGEKGYDVLLDDRDERAGAKFKDADLIGVPVRVTIGEHSLREGKIEIRLRKSGEVIKVDRENTIERIRQVVQGMASGM